MRKLIVISLLISTVALGVVCVSPLGLYALEAERAGYLVELPASLQEDLSLALNNEEPQLTLTLSHQEFFYDETISVSIQASSPGAKIYYTLDSSTPTNSSEIYTEPLMFEANEDVKCVVLKVVAIAGGEESPVLTHSYFIGEGVHERFETDYVFSLSTDADNLYGYEEGILVKGKVFDDYMAEHSDINIDELWHPGNFAEYGREWERPIHVEVLTYQGKLVISQDAGIRVFGGSSRYYAQKSLRLYARKEYEQDGGRFKYAFFDNRLTIQEYRTPIMSYNSLVLRNDGTDGRVGARLRTPLASWIAEETGFDVVSPYAAVAVFLNGEYYGYAVLNAVIDEHYLQDLYNAQERAFDIIDGGNDEVYTEDEDIVSSFAEVLTYAYYGIHYGITDDTIQVLEEAFDVSNLLFYYAFQAYIANSDFPHNNIKIWRYTGSFDESIFACELDGRWRFVMYDLDMSMGFLGNINDAQTLSLFLEGERKSPILAALLRHPIYAEEFSNYICDFAYEHFSLINVERTIEEINAFSLSELEKTSIAYEREFGSILDERKNITDFIAQRPAYILAELRELFGYTDMYYITTDGTAKINTLNGNEGQYFIENSVPITPILEKGQAFDYWLVNGELRHEEELRVSFADADADNTVHIQCVTREELPPLFFLDTYDREDICGFTMYNPTDTTQSTQGLYLSDNINNLKKWPFPRLNIRPGAVWEFVGSSSTSYDALLKIGLNFNPRYGEVIFLSNEEGEVLDWMAVSR